MRIHNIQRKWLAVMLSFMFICILAACGGQEPAATDDTTENNEEGSGANGGGEASETTAVKLVLNWFPKSQQGGFFAADSKGYFEENGLEVEIEPGGPQVSSIQIVASGQAQFGLAHADQLVIARNQGIELVAIAASLQNSPAAMMFHEGAGIEDFEDMNGRTAYIQPGIPYWAYLQAKYDLSGVTELGYTGQHVNFIDDPNSVSQSFVTSEPFFLEREGVATETILVSESGFDPYNVVLFVTKDYLEGNKGTVQQFMNAFTQGWDYYENNSEEINEVIQVANPNIELEELAFETEAQKEFVYGNDAAEHGVGYMTEERWSTLISQLLELELLDDEVEATEIFTTEFLE
ncbi:ABC transporter substrate-binding protein [Bacillus suaedae]|uniref:ABC transporter substrate-binding protein n=1 Tax=Halalkalibacter suaedae TaxID=2822140 RepID=A0A940WU01_9BACI|nr:ABC transporter substrate-binding protein [Bacillus suaedae]MBP3952445.1 ABC transporter substrate-binding protein [Bacillus suaedae]